MNRIDPTIPSTASLAPPALTGKITPLFQKFAPFENQANSLGYDRLAIIVFVISAIAYVFYSIFYPAKVEPPKMPPSIDPFLALPFETLLEDFILKLKIDYDKNQLLELNTLQSPILSHINSTIKKVVG